jgi:L-ascorbate metabolism protein UlaG (beta-lactamase superfamily)
MGRDRGSAEKGGVEMTLLSAIDQTITATPSLWWLGGAGFVVRFASITFYVDPCFDEVPLDPVDVTNADMILATSVEYIDSATAAILDASKHAKVILPKSAADAALSRGVSYHRMTTTDSGLRIEYFKDNLYSRVYCAPSSLAWTADEGYPSLGYLIRFGRWTIYHAGNCAPYEGLADRLRPFNVSVALLPIGKEHFSAAEAAQLASAIGASWLVPYGTPEPSFVEHLLGHCPGQRFKVFEPGEGWTVPED